MTDFPHLRDLVARFILGEDDIEAFRGAFAPESAEVNFDEASPELAALVDRVDTLLVRYDIGEINDRDLTLGLSQSIGLTMVTIEAEQVFPSGGTARFGSVRTTTDATLVEA